MQAEIPKFTHATDAGRLVAQLGDTFAVPDTLGVWMVPRPSSRAGETVATTKSAGVWMVPRPPKAAGATGWLTKPFDPDQLVRIAKKVLGR
jgi:CheY-like chemotaxis protein